MIAGVDGSDAAFVLTKRLRAALSLIVGKMRSGNGPRVRVGIVKLK